MADYKDRFDKWQKDAKEKFDELDKQLGIKEKLDEGVRVVAETAKTVTYKIEYKKYGGGYETNERKFKKDRWVAIGNGLYY